MSAKMTVSVYDTIHQHIAQSVTYDLWRIDSPNNRVLVKQDTIINDNEHILIEATREDQLGSFELILYVKDYFDQFHDLPEPATCRFIIPFGMNSLDRNEHLNIHISPTSFTCTL